MPSKIDYSNRPALAIGMVTGHIQSNLEKTDPPVDFNVYCVWFCYILGGWKALCSSTLPDGRYYEVTYNKDTDEVYIDTYVKIDNTAYDIQEVTD